MTEQRPPNGANGSVSVTVPHLEPDLPATSPWRTPMPPFPAADQLPNPTLTVNGKELPLMTVLESLLFVADGPVEVTQLAKTLALDSEAVYAGLQVLDQHYIATARGLRIQEYNGKFQLVTLPVLAPLIEHFLNLDLSTKLSAPALETLAIVAYRQPVTRAQVEAVRGVDSSGVLRSLVQRNLIQESGRLEGVGRPILYSVTETFMHHFGLVGLDELPPLETTEADTLWAATKLAELEDEAA
ncbi:MAG: SMC-Scp complex subunit ScpB [Caldilineaceae bacterium]